MTSGDRKERDTFTSLAACLGRQGDGSWTSDTTPGLRIPLLGCVLVAQSCLTLYDPIDYSLPGSSVYGILQARILEWFADDNTIMAECEEELRAST